MTRRGAHRASGAVVLALAACAAREPERPHPRTLVVSRMAPDPGAVAPPDAVAGSVARLEGAAPLAGFRAEAKRGDLVLRNEGSVAVVSATTGRLLDFGAVGGRDELVSIDPSVSFAPDGGKPERLDVEAVEAHERYVEARWRVVGARLAVHVFYTFEGKALRIETVLASRGDGAPSASLGEAIAWGNVPTWVEGSGFAANEGALAGAFVGRDALGVAYALGTSWIGRVHFPPPSPGFWAWPRTSDDVGPLAPDGTPRRRVAWLATSTRSIGDAARALPKGATTRYELPAALAGDLEIETRRCGATPDAPGSPYAPMRVSASQRDFAVPGGCIVARLAAPGHAPGPWLAPAAFAAAGDGARPRAGKLAWSVTEHGRAIPARILVRGAHGTPDPSWGEDPSGGAVLGVVYADRAGERPLPPGRYVVNVTRGFEYTARDVDVTIVEGHTSTVAAELERVVDTRGWIAADLHLHAEPSPDAPTRLADRVRSLAGAGVEVGVATDHNAVTDYSPVIAELGLGAFVASIVGDEITTHVPRWGHFNTFPLAPGSTPIPAEDTTPLAIFAAARAAAPGGVVQVNHPRMGDIGYFDLLHFDPSDVDGWRAKTPVAAMDFDAIEVFNGDHYAEIDKVEQCLRDWYALLDAGQRATATGNSDSHKLAYHEAGAPRTYVRVDDDDPSKLDSRAFVDAIRKGRVVVSSGPFVRITAGDPKSSREIGDTVAAGTVDVRVRVDAPPWVDVDHVALVGRGGVVLHEWHVLASTRATRLDARAKIALKKGDWVVAVARGKKPMAFLHRAGATPFAFTNPIFGE